MLGGSLAGTDVLFFELWKLEMFVSIPIIGKTREKEDWPCPNSHSTEGQRRVLEACLKLLGSRVELTLEPMACRDWSDSMDKWR